MERTVQGIAGPICYTFTRKRVKNLNLRLGPQGQVRVSAPAHVPAAEVDAFVRAKEEWICRAKARLAARPGLSALPPCDYTDAQCEAALFPFVRKYAPLFADRLEGALPQVRYRTMKSRWGVCYPTKGRITLNRWLLDRSAAAQEYVVLHELVHFHHPDHQKGFYRELEALMPDYRTRQAELRRLGG